MIAIIGLLATLSVVALSNARSRARDSRRIADIKQIQLALYLFRADEDEYPDPTVGAHNLTGSQVGTTNVYFLEGSITSSENTFLNPIPGAPEPADGPCTSTNNPYRYERVSADSYELHYCLGNSTGGIPSGPRTATQDSIFNPN